MMLDPDLTLVIGLVIGLFSIPSMISAYSDERPPRVAALCLVLAGGLILNAMQNKPGGFRVSELPHVFYGVVGRLLD
ncbi:hypothetical protein [Puniceibacterium sp. IMCC21224]|uniref:hypothetical protein n=1 Tax=Puniceibacterium sp. IMCC21224 TaxID=1618204 RepID=UPI00065D2BB4|nr:hypothetical protein [Puniceibacterium sp. IMCC21224]KMK68421.1 hypothetical protein IMCC21224_113303 [Puniceibacterium sp. IMCC21224]